MLEGARREVALFGIMVRAFNIKTPDKGQHRRCLDGNDDGEKGSVTRALKDCENSSERFSFNIGCFRLAVSTNAIHT